MLRLHTGVLWLPLTGLFLIFFARCLFRAAPQLTEHLEEDINIQKKPPTNKVKRIIKFSMNMLRPSLTLQKLFETGELWKFGS